MITATREGEDLIVSNDSAVVKISQLSIRSSGKRDKPHQLLGKAGSSMLLTDREMAEVAMIFVLEFTELRVEDLDDIFSEVVK